MPKKNYVLDASAIIGGFYSKSKINYTTPDVILEIKDLKSSLLVQSAIDNGDLVLDEPDDEDIIKTHEIIESSGDILRLSSTDKNLIALALKLKRIGYDPIVVTDDFTIQNSLKIINMPYKSVLTSGIDEVYNWLKICKGCKKKYPTDYDLDECEICGSPITKRRIKK